MNPARLNTWQSVHDEVLRRIQARRWMPGALIPNETQLAKEFGCARTTVNRALRALADAGLLDRRRKAGTRIAMHPVRKVSLNIPVIRLEIEDKGQRYAHTLIHREIRCPPRPTRQRMQLEVKTPCLHLIALHQADDKPHALEDRWINLDTVPAAAEVNFSEISANEWLVLNAPFTSGEIAFAAINAQPFEASHLSVAAGTALLQMSRQTWTERSAITSVRMTFAPGYRLDAQI